jgi:hypothetical protein
MNTGFGILVLPMVSGIRFQSPIVIFSLMVFGLGARSLILAYVILGLGLNG